MTLRGSSFQGGLADSFLPGIRAIDGFEVLGTTHCQQFESRACHVHFETVTSMARGEP